MIQIDVIKRISKEKRYTIAELERACQLTPGTIKRWNSTVPGVDKVEKVADVLGCSIDELCGRKDLTNPDFVVKTAQALNAMYTEEDYAMLQAFHLLNDTDKLAVVNLIMKLKFKKEEE